MGEGYGFEWALAELRKGRKLTRYGWNGKGMYIVMQEGYPDGIAINSNTAKATGLQLGTKCIFQPYIMFRTAQGSFVPWVASQTDLLKSDWNYEENI